MSVPSIQSQKNFQIIFSKYGVEKYDAFDDVGGKTQLCPGNAG